MSYNLISFILTFLYLFSVPMYVTIAFCCCCCRGWDNRGHCWWGKLRAGPRFPSPGEAIIHPFREKKKEMLTFCKQNQPAKLTAPTVLRIQRCLKSCYLMSICEKINIAICNIVSPFQRGHLHAAEPGRFVHNVKLTCWHHWKDRD